MSPGRRVPAEQAARRINAAAHLLGRGLSLAAATRRLAKRFKLSERHARRYVERAHRGGAVELPERKIVFTVKLPATVVHRIRDQARRRGQTLSGLVAHALQSVLDVVNGGTAGGE